MAGRPARRVPNVKPNPVASSLKSASLKESRPVESRVVIRKVVGDVGGDIVAGIRPSLGKMSLDNGRLCFVDFSCQHCVTLSRYGVLCWLLFTCSASSVVVYLFNFKGLVFTCSASSGCCFCFLYAYCTKFRPSCKPQSGYFLSFSKDFISRSNCREASIAHLLQCRNQRRVCGDCVLFHNPSRDVLKETHAFVLSRCCCCFHNPIISSRSSKVNPNRHSKYYFVKVVVTYCHART
jgi:hypothetical protein